MRRKSPQTSQPHNCSVFAFQKTKDHFLEVKMESSRQHFFHLRNDFAYIEVSTDSAGARLLTGVE
jgi:hypothetical protein